MQKNIITILALIVLAFANTGCVTSAMTSALGSSLPGDLLGAVFNGNDVGEAVYETVKDSVMKVAEGGFSGPALDEYDLRKISQVMETIPSAKIVGWENPYTLKSYEAVAKPCYILRGSTCRNAVVRTGYGTRNQMEVIARRIGNGNWQIIQIN